MSVAKAELGKWIPVNASTFIRGSRIVEPQPSADMGTFTAALSVYDVPEAVRAHRDSNGSFVIDLRYINSEPTVEVRKDPVWLQQGGSGRIYQIKVLAPEEAIREIHLPDKIYEALENLQENAEKGFGPRERIKVVEDIINNEGARLFVTPRYIESLNLLMERATTDLRNAIKRSWELLGGAVLRAAKVSGENVQPGSEEVSDSLKRLEGDTQYPYDLIRSIRNLEVIARQVLSQSSFAYDLSPKEAERFVLQSVAARNELGDITAQ